MILYHPSLGTELSDYGINLPLRDDRSEKVFEILKEQFPELVEVNPQEIPLLELSDLSGIHEEEFLKRMANNNSFLEEVLKAYDCAVESERYQKDQAKKPISELRASILRQVSATSYGLRKAIENQFCFFLGGGMHHGHYDHGSGFCPLNDIVISLKLALREEVISSALVIDIDAHFGDGTAQMTVSNEEIKTFSIHMKDAWPLDQNQDSRIHSDVDIPIGVGEEESYIEKLSKGLENFSQEKFDCVIVVAGADPHCDDELLSTQKLRLSSSQMLARDLLVYKWCKERGIPQLWLMAGGYGRSAPQIYAQFILKVLHLMR